MEPLIRVKNMYKIYNPGENEVRALDDVSLEINQGEFIAIAVLTHLIPGNIFWTEKMLPISQTMNCLISAITRSASSFRDLI